VHNFFENPTWSKKSFKKVQKLYGLLVFSFLNWIAKLTMMLKSHSFSENTQLNSKIMALEVIGFFWQNCFPFSENDEKIK
jgi:hypothetical protein